VNDPRMYWLQNAIEINSNNAVQNPSDPQGLSNTFIRGVTANGLLYEGKASADTVGQMVQANSDTIGRYVLGAIDGYPRGETDQPKGDVGVVLGIDDFIQKDIGSALEKGNQSIQGWGGAIYYWNTPLGAGAGTTIGSHIYGSQLAYQEFLTINAKALLETVGAGIQQSGSSLWNSGVGGKALYLRVAAVVALCLGPQGASAQSYPEVSRVEWPKTLPPRDTVVDVDTPVGRFTLPVGYVADPAVYAGEKPGADPSGRPTYRDDKLAFKFIMPTGAMTNTALTWYYADDAAGRPDPDPNKYVVWFLRVERDVAGLNVPLDWPKGVLVEGPAAAMPPNVGHSYRGRIEGPATHDTVEVDLFRCNGDVCASTFYFEREGLSFWALVPNRHHQDAFLIAAKASEFLAQWTLEPLPFGLSRPG